MAILTNPGRASVATAIKNETLHLAWGRGNTSWDASRPPENIDAESLTAEFGRRKASQVAYCVPDVNGLIYVPSGRFSISETPTKWLYMRFSFDFLDSPTEVIREAAVFIGTTLKSGVPPSQEYLLPSEVDSPGGILTIEHFDRIDRSPTIRQQFELVVQF
jgi:hypothetical protein